MSQAKTKDLYSNIKRLGYNISQLGGSYNLESLVRYARFYLARRNRLLLKDPIWDEYTQEEILIEFYAHQFVENSEFRDAFEIESGIKDSQLEDFLKWTDKKDEEDKAVLERVMGETENIKFSPSDVIGDD